MEDFTEIYAPPEAPQVCVCVCVCFSLPLALLSLTRSITPSQPDAARPDGYDIYTVGVIGLRALMPALLAGDAGVQVLSLLALLVQNYYCFTSIQNHIGLRALMPALLAGDAGVQVLS